MTREQRKELQQAREAVINAKQACVQAERNCSKTWTEIFAVRKEFTEALDRYAALAVVFSQQ